MENCKLVDCIKSSVIERTNTEWMNVIADVLHEYYRDAYFDECHENIFSIDDAEDFKILIDIYGVVKAVEFANISKCGYIIAGHNLTADDVVVINEDNFWNIFQSMSQDIEDRINKLFHEEILCWEDIQRIYPSLDIKKFLFGEECFVVEKETETKISHTEKSVGHYKFDTYINAKNWVNSTLKALMDETNDFEMRVDSENNIFTFKDLDNCSITKIKFIDYTDRAMAK